jgi:protein-S-isoprenylcysteine O-methyltransferase Ste14
MFVAYASIIAAEEAYLREKFGAQFDAYCARVNRIVPRLTGLGQSIQGMTFNWRRLLLKEYNTFFMGVLQIVALCFLDDYMIDGEAALPVLEHSLMFLAPWAALYLAIWALKKTGRLQEEPTAPRSADRRDTA